MSQHPEQVAGEVVGVRPVEATLDELVDRARGLVSRGTRSLLGITGTPGAGKSTLCAALLDTLDGDAVLVGMDGFHFASEELIRLGRSERKGASDTFDVDGYGLLHLRIPFSAAATRTSNRSGKRDNS